VAPQPRKTTVLVVEDDRALRTFYQSALMLAGYAVVTAEDGVEALRLIDGTLPGAVVLDLGLPVLSGRDVSREILLHRDVTDIPIVIVTGGDISDLDLSEFACVLQKPVDPESLIKAVDACLKKPGDPPRRA
jgi:DNA-binding response OmpR family regulator